MKECSNGNSQLTSSMAHCEGKNSIEGGLPKITKCICTFYEAVYLHFTREERKVLLKVWSPDQPHLHHLRIC